MIPLIPGLRARPAVFAAALCCACSITPALASSAPPDTVADLDAGYAGTLGDLAHRHGWFDQAHFSRDFAALVGVTPGDYRASSRRTPE